MKIEKTSTDTAQLLQPDSAAWRTVRPETLAMVPTPLKNNPMIEAISPFLARSDDHGKLAGLQVAGLHNGDVLALRLSWSSEGRDTIRDLDQFVDGIAVMFPLSARASAVTMGSPGEPVNAWYWKADSPDKPFDVVAEGYGTSVRRDSADSGLQSAARYQANQWQVVLARKLDAGNRHAQFWPGTPLKIAFALWDGGNQERAGRKSFSGEFNLVDVAA